MDILGGRGGEKYVEPALILSMYIIINGYMGYIIDVTYVSIRFSKYRHT